MGHLDKPWTHFEWLPCDPAQLCHVELELIRALRPRFNRDRRLDLHGDLPDALPSPIEALCDECSAPFPLTRPWARFCSPECRKEWHTNPISRSLAEALRRDIDELRQQIAALQQATHKA